jgi:hypothetical protein
MEDGRRIADRDTDGGWKMKDETKARTRGPEDMWAGGLEDRKPESIEFGLSSMGKYEGRRRADEGRGVASPRPPNKKCTINRAPTLVLPAANV